MTNPFIRKLEYGAQLSEEDRRQLEAFCRDPRAFPAHVDLVSEGDKPRSVHLVMEGYACRYKILPDGRRQIMALFVPGDICDLHVQILGEMDHSIGTLTECSIVEVGAEAVDDLIRNPRINRALWWSTLVDEGTLREWLVSMGQRDAAEQMAHIFCEVYTRLKAVGQAEDGRFRSPVTQEEMADLMGLTPVHVNRTLKLLREQGLIELDGKWVVIPHFERLRQCGGFDPNYLHLKDRNASKAEGLQEVPAS
jgi:CRP-like cAMP-binding protein